jgi:predicted GTPase
MHPNLVTKEEKLIYSLASIYQALNQYGDDEQARKVLDLYKKLENNEVVIGFTGHFSAGKSTMLNFLMDEEILPSSPIPTSANIVMVKRGEQLVRLFLHDNSAYEWKGSYDIEKIKSWGKNGELIKEIFIRKPLSALPENVILMDTPGIDSSDDADRVITESKIHMIDALFYVMDYNHVQSDVNLSFLKNIQSKGKDFYIVINQIDKHQDVELSFEAFQNSVEKAMSIYGIYPKEIFYTSMKDFNHPYNEMDKLRTFIYKLFEQVEIDRTVVHAAKAIIEDHILHEKNEKQLQMDSLQAELEELESKINPNEAYLIRSKKEDALNKAENAEVWFKKELQTILKNAYLMSFENRELAKHYLESLKSKGGFFFSKKKQAEATKSALEKFYYTLMETAKSQLEWHVRELLLTCAKKFGVNDQSLLDDIQNYELNFEMDKLKQLIKPGAEVTGNYLLVYTEDVANDLKKTVKEDITPFWDRLKSILQEASNRELKETENILHLYKRLDSVKAELAQIDQSIKEREMQLSNYLIDPTIHNDEGISLIKQELQLTEKSIKDIDRINFTDNSVNRDVKAEAKKETFKEKQDNISVEKLIAKLEVTEHHLRPIKGFASFVNDLQKRKERLQKRKFTVALFGAFSAGKSSFANALLGERILPVSPNPTTAAINKISPPTNIYSHEAVIVKIKTEEQILDDLRRIIEPIPADICQLHQFVEWIRKRDIKKLVKRENNNDISYIQGIVEGFEQLSEKLGQQIEIHLRNASKYIADEKYACYVEWMEIFYNCPLTQMGITLVDTPGADSINARHTNVAFEYIKEADAILFVTYYNHAFSKADQEFLIQLGLVQDIFSLDKMFFIVNAIDLANNEEEIQLVTEYMENNLIHFGIRNPRMYPLSSKLALSEKLNDAVNKTSRMNLFENDFLSFVENDLTGILAQTAIQEWKRAVQALEQYIKQASLNKEEKLKLKEKYQLDLITCNNLLNEVTINRLKQSLEQEINELVFYINQRTSLRFTDIFKEHINPSTIKNNGRAGREEVKVALQELFERLSNILIKELQATSFRVETFISKLLNEFILEVEKLEPFVANKLSFSKESDIKIPTPELDIEIKLDNSTFEKIVAMYKNTKTFFGLNEREKFKNSLEDSIKPIIKKTLEKQQTIFQEYYLLKWFEQIEMEKTKMKSTINDYFEGLMISLDDHVDVVQLKEIYTKIIQE